MTAAVLQWMERGLHDVTARSHDVTAGRAKPLLPVGGAGAGTPSEIHKGAVATPGGKKSKRGSKAPFGWLGGLEGGQYPEL